ncbi:divergent PAP2 family protein [Gorillibacterium massiliense]|uniref:divergent PAP2 family protein n=1 Tax=Gorillibacterium massiliense TaxID=1280390 RepID=UPI0004B4FDF2|nr:divergent PAP2 family protein [Gorillibacterium massiliense]
MNSIVNFPLFAALISVFTAQIVKVPIHFFSTGHINVKLAFSTGGMPSSHSAAVVSLAAAVGMKDGFSSSLFAVAAMFSIITMYDAAGVRRQAGTHASILNRMTRVIPIFQNGQEAVSTLKEMLGHRPSEVCAGAVLGLVVSILLRFIL